MDGVYVHLVVVGGPEEEQSSPTPTVPSLWEMRACALVKAGRTKIVTQSSSSFLLLFLLRGETVYGVETMTTIKAQICSRCDPSKGSSLDTQYGDGSKGALNDQWRRGWKVGGKVSRVCVCAWVRATPFCCPSCRCDRAVSRGFQMTTPSDGMLLRAVLESDEGLRSEWRFIVRACKAM